MLGDVVLSTPNMDISKTREKVKTVTVVRFRLSFVHYTGTQHGTTSKDNEEGVYVIVNDMRLAPASCDALRHETAWRRRCRRVRRKASKHSPSCSVSSVGNKPFNAPQRVLTQPRSHLLAANTSHRCPSVTLSPLHAFVSSHATDECMLDRRARPT